MLLTEYDLRQLILIQREVVLFDEKKIDLFDITIKLGSILNSLEYVSESWKEDFKSAVNVLEIIHDSIEDGSISRWKGNYEEDMHKALSKIKKMIFSILEEYLRLPDPNISENAIEGDSNWLICPKCNNAWGSHSLNAMVICPKCDRALHNPRILKNGEL